MPYGYENEFHFSDANLTPIELGGARRRISDTPPASDVTGTTAAFGTSGGTRWFRFQPLTAGVDVGTSTPTAFANVGWKADPDDWDSVADHKRVLRAGTMDITVRLTSSALALVAAVVRCNVWRAHADASTATLIGSVNFTSVNVSSTIPATASAFFSVDSDVVFGLGETLMIEVYVQSTSVIGTGNTITFVLASSATQNQILLPTALAYRFIRAAAASVTAAIARSLKGKLARLVTATAAIAFTRRLTLFRPVDVAVTATAAFTRSLTLFRRFHVPAIAGTRESSYSAAVLADAPRALWMLDDASGPAQDSSGFGRHAAVTGVVSFAQDPGAGLPGQSSVIYVNNPAGTFDNYLRATGVTFPTANRWTMEGWIKPDSPLSGAKIFLTGTSGPFFIQPSTSTIGVGRTISGGTYNPVSFSGGITAGVWSYIAVTFDGSDLRVYVNGTLRGVLVGTSTGTFPGTWDIGRYTNNSANSFVGQIARIALYDAALSSARIAEHYAIGRMSYPALIRKVKLPKFAMALIGGPYTGPAYSAVVLADAPVGYWRLGEASGTQATDSSGNGRHGTYVGTPTLNQPGAIAGDANAAVEFDATDDRVTTPATMTTFLGGNPVSFSMEAWIYPTGINSGNQVVIFNSLGFHVGLLMENTQGASGVPYDLVFIVSRSGGPSTSLRWNDKIRVNRWTHVAGTFDQATGTMRLYIDGVEAPTTGSWVSTNAFNSAAPSIGGDAGVGLRNFRGSIDEVALYNVVLSPERIAARHAAGRALGPFRAAKKIGLPRLVSVAPALAIVRKLVMLPRAFAVTAAVAVNRALTLRRTFAVAIAPTARAYLKLAADKIPGAGILRKIFVVD